MIPAVFPLSVPGVGDFTFRRRTVRDQVWIESDAVKTFGGLAPVRPTVPAQEEDWTEDDTREVAAWLGSASLWELALAVPTVERLMVTGPAGWNMDKVDPLDREQTNPILSVYRGLRAAEEKFRQRVDDNGPDKGAGA